MSNLLDKFGFIIWHSRENKYWAGDYWVGADQVDKATIYPHAWRAVGVVEDMDVMDFPEYDKKYARIQRVRKVLTSDATFEYSKMREELDGGYKNDEHSRD